MWRYGLWLLVAAVVAEAPYDKIVTGRWWDWSVMNPIFGLLIALVVCALGGLKRVQSVYRASDSRSIRVGCTISCGFSGSSPLMSLIAFWAAERPILNGSCFMVVRLTVSA